MTTTDQPVATGINCVVADNITSRAAALGIYGQAIAYAASISTVELGQSLNGRRTFDLEELAGIAGVLGCRVSDLLAEDDKVSVAVDPFQSVESEPASVDLVEAAERLGISLRVLRGRLYEFPHCRAGDRVWFTEAQFAELRDRFTPVDPEHLVPEGESACYIGQVYVVEAKRYIALQTDEGMGPENEVQRLRIEEARQLAGHLLSAVVDLEAGKGCI
jgi:transcriptional regulator with XRE-family HTH domain